LPRIQPLCKIQLICKILTPVLIVALIITVAFVFLYPKPTVQQLPFRTRITLTYGPQKIVPGEAVTINGTLEYEDPWEPFPDQDIDLYYAQVESEEWRPIGTATTDIQGQFEYVWIVNLPLGEYMLKATYAGDERHGPCEAITYRSPKGLLVIPEAQAGSIAALTCMVVALIVIMRRKKS